MYLFCLLINQIFFYYVHVCWHFAEFRLAVVQLHVSKVKADNLCRAKSLIKEASGQGAKVVVLPVSVVMIGL